MCVPGENGVSVVHGSAHGIGIYTATDPRSSVPYAPDGRMLLCAVLDDPDHVKKGK